VIRNKTGLSVCNPLLISIIFVIVILSIFHINYSDYNKSARYLSYLLTPATVSLAIPLYLHIDRLKRNWVGILVGLLAGSLTSMGSVLAMSVLFRLSHQHYVTLLPKSITTAIGMSVSDELGGVVTISVAVIIVTGILGNVIAVSVLKALPDHRPCRQRTGYRRRSPCHRNVQGNGTGRYRRGYGFTCYCGQWPDYRDWSKLLCHALLKNKIKKIEH
jgi:putative effector of murein hydrolase